MISKILQQALGADPRADLSSYVTSCLPKASGLYWDGRWFAAGDGTPLVSINPSTGEGLGDLVCGGARDVDAAVASARAAQKAWACLQPLERANCLRESARIVREHAAELALLDAANCGNPVRAMLLDAEIAASQLEYFAGLALELKGETLPTGANLLNYSVREPLGVVVRIFPFNHPFMFAAGKIAAPLVVGNTVIVKPPEQAPLSTIRLFELLEGVFPPGVLNCVVGDRQTGAMLSAHPDVAAVALIGSVPAGQAVLRSAADTLKRTLLELGGKNAMIVYPDADLEKAAAGAVRGMNFTWCGQSCGSTSRLFVHDSIYDDFVGRVVRLTTEQHRPGIATHMATTMGALASRAQYDRTLLHIDMANREGAHLLCGGKRPDVEDLRGGFFVEPTIFDDVLPTMRLAREEVFGPVLAVRRWDGDEELFAEVNGTEFGLTAAIWTSDLATAHQAAMRVEAGYVWINSSSSHTLGAPFGGYKHSGLGREESKDEMFEFTHLKNINVSL